MNVTVTTRAPQPVQVRYRTGTVFIGTQPAGSTLVRYELWVAAPAEPPPPPPPLPPQPVVLLPGTFVLPSPSLLPGTN